MPMEDDIRPVTYLKTRPAHVLAQLNATRRPIVITQDGKPRAVLQDPESYESLRKALGMLKLLAQGEADAAKGRAVTQDRLFSRLAKKLARPGMDGG